MAAVWSTGPKGAEAGAGSSFRKQQQEPGRELRLVALLLFLQNSDQVLTPLSGLFQPTQIKSNLHTTVGHGDNSVCACPSPPSEFSKCRAMFYWSLCPHCLWWCPVLGDVRFGEEWMSRCLTSSGRVTGYYSGPNLFRSTSLSWIAISCCVPTVLPWLLYMV